MHHSFFAREEFDEGTDGDHSGDLTRVDIASAELAGHAFDDGAGGFGLFTFDGRNRDRAIIEGMTRKLSAGDVYAGKVTRVIPIGAFVEFLPGKEGMVHISQLADYRVGKVEDEVAVGDDVVVKVREVDGRGRINLTRLGIHPDEAAAARAAVE